MCLSNSKCFSFVWNKQVKNSMLGWLFVTLQVPLKVFGLCHKIHTNHAKAPKICDWGTQRHNSALTLPTDKKDQADKKLKTKAVQIELQLPVLTYHLPFKMNADRKKIQCFKETFIQWSF